MGGRGRPLAAALVLAGVAAIWGRGQQLFAGGAPPRPLLAGAPAKIPRLCRLPRPVRDVGAREAARYAKRWGRMWKKDYNRWRKARRNQTVISNLMAQETIRAIRHSGRWHVALQVLRDLRYDSVEASRTTYNEIFETLLLAQPQAQKLTLELLGDMAWAQVKPDADTYDALIRSAVLFTGWSSRIYADYFLTKSLASLEHTNEERLHRKGIQSCLRLHKWELALHELAKFPKKGITPSPETIAIAMGVPRWNVALQLFEDFQKSSRGPPTNVALRRALADTCRRGGNLELPFVLMKQQVALKLKPDPVIFDAAIAACLNQDRADNAKSFLKMSYGSLPQWERDPAAFSAAIRSCGRVKNWKAAMALLLEMRDTIPPNEDVLNAAVFANMKCNQTVMELYKEITGLRFQPNAHTVLAATLEWEKWTEYEQEENVTKVYPGLSLSTWWKFNRHRFNDYHMDDVPLAVRHIHQKDKRQTLWTIRRGSPLGSKGEELLSTIILSEAKELNVTANASGRLGYVAWKDKGPRERKPRRKKVVKVARFVSVADRRAKLAEASSYFSKQRELEEEEWMEAS